MNTPTLTKKKVNAVMTHLLAARYVCCCGVIVLKGLKYRNVVEAERVVWLLNNTKQQKKREKREY